VGGIRASLDTRSKILTLAEALALPAPIVIAAGTFDLLRAEHARELEQIRAGPRKLLVVVLSSSIGLLTARARAEMVAALRVVDYVIIADDEHLERLSRAHPDAQVARLDAADRCRIRQLIEHVRRRNITPD
jgi:glycerol-3-phosphate cytidylyltransferase-like family protein